MLSMFMSLALFVVMPPTADADDMDVITDDGLVFRLVIKTPNDGTAFILPTSSRQTMSYYTYYSWQIDWGDGSSEINTGNASRGGGIEHVYESTGVFTITITPNDNPEAWLAAFGFSYRTLDDPPDSNSLANKAMVIRAIGSLRPEMTRSKAQIEGLILAPNYEWSHMFYECENLIQAPTAEGWEKIESVGNSFASSMFYDCRSLVALPDGFNLPQNLTSVGQNFASGMFATCRSLRSLPANFNLPQRLTAVDSFAVSMFNDCSSLVYLPDDFNLPSEIITAGEYFAEQMFYSCLRLTLLSSVFTFPQGIIEAGDSFAARMFSSCVSLVLLPEWFSLPQGMTSVGSSFVESMFQNCFSLYMLPDGFCIPPNITEAGDSFARQMLFGAGNNRFQINENFRLPTRIPADALNAFQNTFQLSKSAPMQNRSAASIIGDCPTPSSLRNTFDAHFSDIDYIAVNWGGGGLTPPSVGAPGSGDINGDGYVTMDEVLTCAQAALGDIGLSPAQLDAIDMDRDGVITMADVMLIYRVSVG